MKSDFEIHFADYSQLLRKLDVAFQEQQHYLIAGDPGELGKELIISLCSLETPAFLRSFIPFLKQNRISFKLIKDQLLQYQQNAGAFGAEHVGRILLIYPESYQLAAETIKKLCELSLSQQLKGPLVRNHFRVDSVLYLPLGSTFTRKFSARKIKDTLPRIIHYRYIPIELISDTIKGKIFKAVSIRKLAFQLCLIKHSRPFALDDHFGRDMRDRLCWQKELAGELAPLEISPAVIDYFELHDSAYLVFEFLEGKSLGDRVLEILKGRPWNALSKQDQKQLLCWYQHAIDITGKIHALGIVHRDITISNFHVSDNGRLQLLDFELAFNLHKRRPWPPFVLGTPGYLAPEQLAYRLPDFPEDLYSLGAVLYFMLTGKNPQTITGSVQKHLKDQPIDADLKMLMQGCMEHNPVKRPSLATIKFTIDLKLNEVEYENQSNHF